MTRRIRTLAFAAAFLAITSGSAFASSPGGTNPVPPATTATSPGGTNPVPPARTTSTTLIDALISLLGL